MVVSMAVRCLAAGMAGVVGLLGGCTEVPDCISSDDASSGIIFAGQLAQGNLHGDAGGTSVRNGVGPGIDKMPDAVKAAGGGAEVPTVRTVVTVRPVAPPLVLPTVARQEDFPVSTPY